VVGGGYLNDILYAGRGLTINTEAPETPAPAQQQQEDGRSSKSGTPRRNWLNSQPNNNNASKSKIAIGSFKLS